MRTALYIVIAFAALLASASAIAQYYHPNQFSPFKKHTYEHKSQSGRVLDTMGYYLLEPIYNDRKKEYPLVVYLHGREGPEPVWRLFAGPYMRSRHPSFVVMPILQKPQRWAEPGNNNVAEVRQIRVMGIIQELSSVLNIDPARIYVTGPSLGGVGTYGMLFNYPETFAAGVPVSATWDVVGARQLANTPIRAFHGARDKAYAVGSAQVVINAVRDLGGDASLSIYKNGDHKIWPKVYTNEEMWQWMFSQKRNLPKPEEEEDKNRNFWELNP